MAEKAKPASQGVDAKFVTRIENLEREIDEVKDSIKEDIAALRADIKSVLEEAEEAGTPKAALRGVIKARKAEAKARAAREALDSDSLKDSFDLIRHALGDLADTPLGGAALVAAA